MQENNFSRRFLDQVQQQPLKQILFCQDHTITNHVLKDHVLDTAADLISIGVRSHDRVMLRAEDSAQWIYHLLALIYIEAVPVILSPLFLASRATEIIRECGCKFFVVDGKDSLVAQHQSDASPIDIARQLSAKAPAAVATTLASDQVGLIISSSGSTGPNNKLVCHSPQVFRHAIDLVSHLYDYMDGPEQKVYSTSRLSFQYAWHHVLAAMEHGHPVVLSNKILAGRNLLDFIQQHQITRLITTPRILTTLCKIKQFDPGKISSLQMILSSGEPLANHIEQDLLDRFAHRVYNGQGSAEVVTYWVAQTTRDYKFQTMGPAVPGAQIRLVDPSGVEVGIKEIGEIWVKMPTVAQGYLNNEHDTTLNFCDGWFKTNDMAWKDAEGFYYCIGRKNNVKKINGLFVSPIEIESALLKIPSIEDCMVAILEQDGKNIVVANLTKSSETEHLDLASIRNFLLSHLEPFKIPKIIKYVHDLPKTSTGKKIVSKIQI
jgi:acyl-coenzyme A synthetase/AMP-(fatty) acid ligase